MVRAQPGPAAAASSSAWVRSASSRCACPASPGTLAWPTQPGRTFADELAGRVRVIAGPRPAAHPLTPRRWPREAGEHLAPAARRGAGLRRGRRPRRRLGARARRAHGRRRDPPALRRRDRRRAQRDAPAVRRRLDRLRAHPARARPHVPGHRLAADARHARARRAAPRRAPRAPVGARGALRGGGRARSASSTTSSAAAAPPSWTASWRRRAPTCAPRPSSSASG